METNNFTTTTDDGKTVSIVSYFTIIGWLIAYFAMHKDKKTDLGSYQLRQTLFLHLIYLVLFILSNILITITLSATIAFVFYALYLVLFVLWIIGFIGAVNGQKKPIPLIGERAQSIFPQI